MEFGALRPKENELAVLFLGQAGFLFSLGKGVLAVDPYLSNSVEKLVGPQARRMWWNSFMIHELRAGAVLLTHDHLDHLDPETLPIWEQAAPPEVYLGPDSVMEHLRALNFRKAALRPLNRGEGVRFGGMEIQAVYARHTQDSIGFVLKTPALSVYVTGDTCLTEELVNERTKGCDVLIACINGIDENLNPEEAAELAQSLGARLLIPMHYGLIPCSTVSEREFDEAIQRRGMKGLKMKPEQAWMLEKRGSEVLARRTAREE